MPGEILIITQTQRLRQTCSGRQPSRLYFSMKNLLLMLAHLLATLATLPGPGGAKAIVADSLLRYCQLNDIKTAKPTGGFIPLLSGNDLGAGHLLPFTECPRAKLAIVNRSCQMPAQSEQVPNHTIHCKEALSLSS